MKPALIVELPAADLPIDRRHQRALSHMQFAATFAQLLRDRLGVEVQVHTVDRPDYQIATGWRQWVHIAAIEQIDVLLMSTVERPESWRVDANWTVVWDFLTGQDDHRTGYAQWDTERIDFQVTSEVLGPEVRLSFSDTDAGRRKRFRCVTPFERPTEYAIERVLDTVVLAWLSWIDASA